MSAARVPPARGTEVSPEPVAATLAQPTANSRASSAAQPAVEARRLSPCPASFAFPEPARDGPAALAVPR